MKIFLLVLLYCFGYVFNYFFLTFLHKKADWCFGVGEKVGLSVLWPLCLFFATLDLLLKLFVWLDENVVDAIFEAIEKRKARSWRKENDSYFKKIPQQKAEMYDQEN